jgi:hypothetical protein
VTTWAERGVPNPGSHEAGERGCICAVIDNGYGRGYLGGMKNPDTGETMFVVTVGCPLHSPASREADR